MRHASQHDNLQDHPSPRRPLSADEVSTVHDLVCAVAGALVLAAAAMGLFSG